MVDGDDLEEGTTMPDYDYDDFDDPRQAADEESSLDVFEVDDTTSTDDDPERDRNAVRRPGRPQRDPNERPLDETVDTTQHTPEGLDLATTELSGHDLSARLTGAGLIGSMPGGAERPGDRTEDPRGVRGRRKEVGDGPPKRGDGKGKGEDVDTSDASGLAARFGARSAGEQSGYKVHKEHTERKDGTKESWTDILDATGNGRRTHEVTKPDGSTSRWDVDKWPGNTVETETRTEPDGSKTQTTTHKHLDEDGYQITTQTTTTQTKNEDGSTTTTTQTKWTDKNGETTEGPQTTTTTPPPKDEGTTTPPPAKDEGTTTPVDPRAADPPPSIYDPLTGEIPIEVQREMDLKLGIGVAHDEPGHNTAEGDGRGVRIRYPDQSDGGGKPYVDPTLINPVNPAVEQDLVPSGSGELTVSQTDLVSDPPQAATASHGVDGGIVPVAPSSSSQQVSGDPLLDPNLWLTGGDTARGVEPVVPTPAPPPTAEPVAAEPVAAAEVPAPQVGPSPAEGQPGDFAGPAPGADAPDLNAAAGDGDEPGFNDDPT